MAAKHVIHWRGGVPVKSYYEGARSDPQRKQRRETGSADAAIARAGLSLREQARHLEQNHDLSRGILDTLVQNTVGPVGIGVDPSPKRADGSIHKEFARYLRKKRRRWAKRPEVTNSFDDAAAQRLAARSLYRDGEVLGQHVAGRIPTLRHGSEIPYSVELIEADYLPMDFSTREKPRVVQGVEKNAWGRPVAYHVYKEHPNDLLYFPKASDLKRVPADQMLHAKMVDRIGQTRGVSIFASVLMRLDDIADYEQSERIAAKVAASMAGYVRKGSPDDYQQELDEDGEPIERDMQFRPGMIFDNLGPGEEIGTIDTNRPNTNLQYHRNGQLKAVAAGTRVTYSSASKTYDGTFSAQRQELVEGWGAYQILAFDFTDQWVRPIYERWLETGVLSGEIEVPADVDIETLYDAIYMPPEMPWIDPYKEAVGFKELKNERFASSPEIIRKRGKNPDDVLEQQAAWESELRERGLSASGEQTSPEDMKNYEDDEDATQNRA